MVAAACANLCKALGNVIARPAEACLSAAAHDAQARLRDIKARVGTIVTMVYVGLYCVADVEGDCKVLIGNGVLALFSSYADQTHNLYTSMNRLM